jgi:hypothetical protein
VSGRRPHGTAPEDLRFTPQQAVRWLSPRQLIRAAVSVVLSDIFGAYSDKRELQQGGVFTQETFAHDRAGELWLDYVSDVGDGFDATYSVASLLAADKLDVDGAPETLPRGEVLVMGGDEVYPVASAWAYEERTTRVYAAALPETSGAHPTLYAVPGNHDWYDGLTAFLRMFAQDGTIGAWRTAQKRSYFALSLPQRWWLLAVDIQLDTYIDAPQLAYFQKVAEAIQPGDGIILCTAKPCWYEAARGEDGSHRRLGYFAEKALGDRRHGIRLVLTGDAHHYARYESPATGQTLLTSGIGGAYTSATHHLDPRITVPPLAHPEGTDTTPVEYCLAAHTWPPRPASRRLAWGVFRLPFRNPGFWALLGGVQAAFVVALLTQTPLWPVLIGLGMLVGTVGFAKPPRGGAKAKVAHGLPHGLAQLGLGTGAAAVCASVADGWPWWVQVVTAAPAAAVLGFLAAELVAAYLLLASWRRANVNELFAAQSLEDHKGFVRLHIGPDGSLRVYPIGLRRVARRWRADPTGGPGDPWLVAVDALRPEFVEPPFTISREPDQGAAASSPGSARTA